MHSAILTPCESQTSSCAFLFKGLSGSKLSILETLDNDILEYADAAEHFAATALAGAA